VTGIIEASSAIALLIPSLAPFGAVLVVPTMTGAVAAHLFVIGGNPIPALLLLAGALAILRTRRSQLADARSRFR
jgi:hypothetical protein